VPPPRGEGQAENEDFDEIIAKRFRLDPSSLVRMDELIRKCAGKEDLAIHYTYHLTEKKEKTNDVKEIITDVEGDSLKSLLIEVEEPPQLSMKVSFSEDVKFEGKGEFSQLSAIKSSIRDLVAVGHSRSIKKGQIIGVAAVIAFLLTITITTVLQTLNQVHLDAQSDVQMSTIIQNYSEALGKVDDSSSAMLTQYQNLSPTAKLDTKIDFLLQEQATELRQQITIGEVLGRENHMERSLYDNFPGPWWARSPQLALGLGILAAMVVAALTRAFLPETGSVFLLGAGARKLERSKKRKQFICWQVILPLAIGILAGILVLKIPL